jgi:hypothetical protein
LLHQQQGTYHVPWMLFGIFWLWGAISAVKVFTKQTSFFVSERLFGKAWREEFVVLYEDSSLIWFRDRDRLDPEGGIFLKDAPEMLAAGQVHP